MSNVRAHERFKDAPWYKITRECISIYGAGGIGSWLALALARCGFNLRLIDFDTVDEVNLAGQFYGPHNIGQEKTIAVVDNIYDYVQQDSINILFHSSKITPENVHRIVLDDIMVVAFDNIYARKLVFEKWVQDGNDISYFIDGRMTVDTGMIFCISHKDQKAIEKYRNEELIDDDLIPDDVCSYKATTNNGMFIGSLMSQIVINVLLKKVNNNPMPLPYKTRYILPMLKMETETV